MYMFERGGGGRGECGIRNAISPVIHTYIRQTRGVRQNLYVYYESRKREIQRRLVNEGRCDERLQGKVEESTYLTHTGLHDKTN